MSESLITSAELRDRVLSEGNTLFPELNLTADDLAQPNEEFLVRVLVHYLKSFGYDVEQPCLTDDINEYKQESILFSIDLAHQIETILKISMESHTFTYYDLIEPTSKKVVSTFDTLFNYRIFYNMHQSNINALLEDGVEEHDELINEIEQLNANIEEHLKREELIQATIENLTEEISETEKEKELVNEEKTEVCNNLKILNTNNDAAAQELEKLEEQKRHWENEVVTAEEMDQLAKQLEEMKECLQRKQRKILALQSGLDDVTVILKEHTDSRNLLLDVPKIIASLGIDSAQIIKKTYMEEKKKVDTEKRRIQETEENIVAQETQLEELSIKLIEHQQDHDNEHKEFVNEINIIEIQKDKILRNKEELEEVNCKLRHQCSKQNEIKEYLLEQQKELFYEETEEKEEAQHSGDE